MRDPPWLEPMPPDAVDDTSAISICGAARTICTALFSDRPSPAVVQACWRKLKARCVMYSMRYIQRGLYMGIASGGRNDAVLFTRARILLESVVRDDRDGGV